MEPFSLGRRRPRRGRRRIRARRRQALRSDATLRREANFARAARSFLQGEPEATWRARLGETLGTGVCALGGALAVTLQDLITEELPQWEEEEVQDALTMLNLKSPDALVTHAGAALAAIICTDCLTVDWDSAEGDILQEQFALLKGLRDFVAYDPITIALGHWAEKRCPPIPPSLAGLPRPADPPPGAPRARVVCAPFGWLTRCVDQDTGAAWLAEFPPLP